MQYGDILVKCNGQNHLFRAQTGPAFAFALAKYKTEKDAEPINYQIQLTVDNSGRPCHVYTTRGYNPTTRQR